MEALIKGSTYMSPVQPGPKPTESRSRNSSSISSNKMEDFDKGLLREHIKNKRAHEGLEDISSDLFTKKPKYSLTTDELQRVLERRQKNKEAAEKSRRKKRDEFEKLQNENAQLQHDKCELVAIIEKLKKDRMKMVKENSGLRMNNEQLKRWIGKRALELGLGSHFSKIAVPFKKGTAPSSELSELQDDHTHQSAADDASDNHEQSHDCRHSPPTSDPESPISDPPKSTFPAPAVPVSRSPKLDAPKPASPASAISAPKSPVLNNARSTSPVSGFKPDQSCSPPAAPASSRPLATVFPASVSPAIVSKSPAPILKVARPSSPSVDFQPVGICTAFTRPRQQEQPPVADEAPSNVGKQKEVSSTQNLQAEQPTILRAVTGQVIEPQQITNFPSSIYPSAAFLLQDGQQVLTTTPELQQFMVVASPQVQQQMLVASPQMQQQVLVVSPHMQQQMVVTVPQVVAAPEAQQESGDNSSTSSVPHRDVDTEPVVTAAEIPSSEERVVPDSTAAEQASVTTAIESLLKLGFKIQMPEGSQVVEQESAEDQVTEASSCITVTTSA